MVVQYSYRPSSRKHKMSKRQQKILSQLDSQIVRAMKAERDIKKPNDYVDTATAVADSKKRIANAKKIGAK